MTTLKTMLKVFLAQKYFTLISGSVFPSTLQERSYETDEDALTYSFQSRVIALFCKKETMIMERICSAEMYANDFKAFRKIFSLYSYLVNEEIALFILKVIFTSYPCSGGWGCNHQDGPAFVLQNALRYINDNNSLDDLANTMVTMHGNPPYIGGADASWERKQLVESAIIIYRQTNNKQKMYWCAKYLWENSFIECCYPHDIHTLLNVLMEINTYESKELFRTVRDHLVSLESTDPSYAMFAEYYDVIAGDTSKFI